MEQIKNGGRLVCPEMNNKKHIDNQNIYVVDIDIIGKITKTKTLEEAYVPLQEADQQIKLGYKNILKQV